jgi:hypothetical protein
LVQEEVPERQMHRPISPMKEVLLHCQIRRFGIAEFADSHGYFADSICHRPDSRGYLAIISLITKRVTDLKAYEMGQR